VNGTFPSIISIPLGNSTAFVIRDRQGSILIDAGIPGREKIIIQSLQKNGVPPEEIKLVVITHVHYDHVGSLAAYLKSHPCPVAVHESEAALLRQGLVVLPAGTGAVGRFMMGYVRFFSRAFTGLTKFSPVKPDVMINRETFLQPYGISGRILHTPGHTLGSLSILLENGTVFVGDLAFNVYPWGGPIFPMLADDIPRLMKSWQSLLAQPVKMIYPSHGRPFPVASLRRAYEARTRSRSR
jgi:hydroxyacylglutathione hydrolase